MIDNDDARPLPTPPHNLDAEQALIGAILINNAAFDRVGSLKSTDFFDPLHAAIYADIAGMLASNKKASPVTMRDAFVHLDGPGGLNAAQYLGTLAKNAGLYENVPSYAQIIREHAHRRQLILLAEDIAKGAFDLVTPAKGIIEDAEQRLAGLVDAEIERVEVTMADAARTALEMANVAYQRGGKLVGLPTGISDLDAKLGGLQPSDFIILAARPGVGKSALAMNIAANVAEGIVNPRTGEVTDGHVHVFSMEMSAAQMAMRIIADKANISSDNIRRGDFPGEAMTGIEAAARRVGSLPITIDQTGGITLARLATRARRLWRRRHTKLIVVDYLQLMSGAEGRNQDNRVQQMTALTTGLKALAKELDVPILCLSQLSRDIEKRAERRPQLSDLRDSGSIEQDADVVMFVHRDDYYIAKEAPNATTEHGLPSDAYTAWERKLAAATGKAQVIIAKHRHGPTGVVDLAFDGARTRFSNLARGDYDATRS